ncbi:hypothetical protein [Burkholderia sp. RF4-BP95]|uniref:hypothetical protein n=1 Tax=Burkholderia sp. RF4-BP95 TaxID=1637845 RepID=UPI0012E3F51A|nr:hypothetical protein [Burkholderia sp. RF4-BP95]
MTGSIKAIKTLSAKSDYAINRATKLKARVDPKKASIKRELTVQAAWQGIKQGGKCMFGEEKKCEKE